MDGSRGSIQRFKMDKHQEAKKKAPIGAHLQKNHISDPNDLLIIVQLWHAELRITWHTNHLVHKKRTGNAFIYVPLVIDKAYVLATKFLLMHCLFKKQESAAHLCRNQIHGSMKQHEDNPPLFLQLKTRGCQNLHYIVTQSCCLIWYKCTFQKKWKIWYKCWSSKSNNKSLHLCLFSFLMSEITMHKLILTIIYC